MRRELLLLSLALSACGGVTTTDDSGADAAPTFTTGDAGTLVGTFNLVHTVSGYGDSASFTGKVYNGPTPATVQWTVALTSGDCRVETPHTPFCTTACGSSAACVADDTCQPYPTAIGVGTVHVASVPNTTSTTTDAGTTSHEATTFDSAPVVNGYQPAAGVVLHLPPFTEGTAVTVDAAGSSNAQAFSLSAPGVAPLALGQTTVQLATGSDVDLTWDAGSAAVGARVTVDIDISHHGGLRGQLLCDTDDDGALTIDSTLVDKLISLGVSGFPSIRVTREKAGSALIVGGRVDLTVKSTTERSITIPGLTSCTGDDDCPSGQTCQDDLQCK